MGIIRKTKSVKILLDEFDKHTSAISAVALIENLSSQMNKTTVYRILDKLENDGVLHSFFGKNGHKWYAKCHDCSSSKHHDSHAHFQCLHCGKVDCLDTDFNVPQIPNHRVEASQVLLQGSCKACLV
ncbi:Fur family transcriptional regulator [Algibacter miyuki]|uniref:Fur family transcriptional regulator n=1 Tax=Algibacter miyuki TaxID=1306933 RepID=A0ABV5GXJ2_9FLAO|nr:transcriptional repressor [Algibacter miyuki]MDN3665923.1 transcriptional repressor [Algibacter miyuki]